jgi:hypothetical protein
MGRTHFRFQITIFYLIVWFSNIRLWPTNGSAWPTSTTSAARFRTKVEKFLTKCYSTDLVKVCYKKNFHLDESFHNIFTTLYTDSEAGSFRLICLLILFAKMKMLLSFLTLCRYVYCLKIKRAQFSSLTLFNSTVP